MKGLWHPPQMSKTMAKIYRTITLSELKTQWFVRKQLNQDHVLMLAELYEASFADAKDEVAASKALPAILVTEADEGVYELVDGRHRKEAMELAGLKQARAEVVTGLSPTELIALAAKANVGGSLPPSREDIQFTVEQMLSRLGMKVTEVKRALDWLPISVLNKYLRNAQRSIADKRLKLALQAVASGQALKEAAKAYDVAEEVLSEAIAGKKSKSKAGLGQINSALTNQFRSHGTVTGRIMNKVLEDYRNGEISKVAAEDAIAHAENLVNKLLLRAADWRNRLRAAELGEPDPHTTQSDPVPHTREGWKR